jgi:5-deoxy-glucuronate isomerase
MKPDAAHDFVFRQADVPAGESGILLSFTPEEAGWSSMGFTVRRLKAGNEWCGDTGIHEAAIAILGGNLTLDWGAGPRFLGKRANVFSGYPSAAYLPPGTEFVIRAETCVEFAVSQASSERRIPPRSMTPADIVSEIRGGGNATRQVLKIIPTDAAADRLMMNEVFTPAGNWSTYPPHKHEVHNLPAECDLDEIYYFRIDDPAGYAIFRRYDKDGKHDVAVTIRDGDAVVIRGGYHMVAAPPGYNSYYLAVLTGSARSLACTTDPQYAHLARNWPPPDARIPLISAQQSL